MSDLIEKGLWVEKYRPRKLSDMVLGEDEFKIFNEWINQKKMPNALFVGSPGSGKTTLARILVNKIVKDKDDVLLLNGSAQRGIDIVRDNIQDFLQSPGFGDSGLRVVFIDEFDYMTGEAQASLRHIIEKFSDYGRFICTANYESKITDAIQSRFQIFRFKKLPVDFIKAYVKNILSIESIQYTEPPINKIITQFYPDVRKIVNTIQSRIQDGKLLADISDIESNEKKIRSFITDLINGIQTGNQIIVNTATDKISSILSEYEVDYNGLYKEIFEDPNIPSWCKIVVLKHANMHQQCMIPSMNFMGMIFQMRESGRKLRELQK